MGAGDVTGTTGVAVVVTCDGTGGGPGGGPGAGPGVKATVAGIVTAMAIHVVRRAMAASRRYAGLPVRYVTVMSAWLGQVLQAVLMGVR
jgi:hypothetical protein